MRFLNQARLARAWFLEITFILPKCVCVLCVSTPEAIKTSGVILTSNDRLNNCSCFSVVLWLLPSMSIGVALVMKCVASQRRLR